MDNCDGETYDEESVDVVAFIKIRWSGFGDESIVHSVVCADGFATNNLDCDDNNVRFSTPRMCDGFDNNCDGLIDGGFHQQKYILPRQ